MHTEIFGRTTAGPSLMVTGKSVEDTAKRGKAEAGEDRHKSGSGGSIALAFLSDTLNIIEN